jgi:uncharacterized damage-inducible protein DinB
MNHIYEVDLYYLDALTGGGSGRAIFDRTHVTNPRELAAQQAASDAQLIAFCSALTRSTLAGECLTDRREGQISERVSDILPHVFQHQIHHRGQAHVQLQSAGVAPPQLDDFFLAHGRARTAQAFRDLETDHG